METFSLDLLVPCLILFINEKFYSGKPENLTTYVTYLKEKLFVYLSESWIEEITHLKNHYNYVPSIRRVRNPLTISYRKHTNLLSVTMIMENHISRQEIPPTFVC